MRQGLIISASYKQPNMERFNPEVSGFLEIFPNLDMIEGFKPKHRIKTFYRHED